MILFKAADGPRISFDIDDTLVCGLHVPTEDFVPVWMRRRYPEPVRRGTSGLLRALTHRGFRIWIYTTSRRPIPVLKGWFRAGGVRLDGIINLDVHEEIIGLQGPSKFPPAFGIDLHIDDSAGVAMEGESHGFRVLQVRPDDPDWTRAVLAAAAALPRTPGPLVWRAPAPTFRTGAHFSAPGHVR